MKVLLLNGSPKPQGCTFTALSEVAAALNAGGVETEILHVGMMTALEENLALVSEKLDTADGVVFGSPVHYAAPSGIMQLFMQRLALLAGDKLKFKPAACVASARRGGTTTTLEVLNKVPQYFQMPLISGQYWPMVHGSNPEQVMQDEEGLQIMRSVGANMAWILQCIEAGKAAGINHPTPETGIRTDFYKA